MVAEYKDEPVQPTNQPAGAQASLQSEASASASQASTSRQFPDEELQASEQQAAANMSSSHQQDVGQFDQSQAERVSPDDSLSLPDLPSLDFDEPIEKS